MARGGARPNAGRKPVLDGGVINWRLQRSTIDMVKLEAKRYGLLPGAMADKILSKELRGR